MFLQQKRIVGFFCSNLVLVDNNGKTPDNKDIIQYLLQYQDSINCFYHLSACTASIFKQLNLTLDQLWSLYEIGECHMEPDITLFYIHNKYFAVKKGFSFDDPYVQFCDISQYIPWHIDNDLSYAYALQKAQEAWAIGLLVYNGLVELELRPDNLTSPIRVYEKQVLNNMKLPTVDDLPLTAGQYAYYSTYGGWLEAFSKGHYAETWDYDISCYSDDTEALTPDGWKLLINLTLDDFILTFDKNSNQTEFQKVKAIQKKCVENINMYNIKTRNSDLLITANHTTIFKQNIRSKNSKLYKINHKMRFNDKWEIKQTSELPNGNFIIPVSYPLKNRNIDFNISDELLQIIAWINTEGHDNGYYLSITQSTVVNNAKCEEIKLCLDKLNINYSRIRIGQSRHEFHIKSKDCKWYLRNLLDKNDIHLIPRWILKYCSIRQMKLYYETLIKGDGTSKNISKSSQFFTKLEENANRLLELQCCIGNKSCCGERLDNNKKIRYTVYTNSNSHNPHNVHIQFNQISTKLYTGTIVCPSVDNGFIIVKRNGKVCISGNSAYPSELAKLYDTRYGNWIQSKEYQLNAVYGYVTGTAEINARFSPMLLKSLFKGDTMTYTPTGTFNRQFDREYCINKRTYETIYKYGLGKFTINDGWWWIPHAKVQPLKPLIDTLYRHKESSDGIEKDNIKRIMSGVWGKLLEVHGDSFGPHFNPVWGAEVEINTRLNLFEMCMQNSIVPLSIAVDGVLTDKQLNITGNGYGSWKLSSHCPALVISSGIVATQEKTHNHDFSLDYDWLMDSIKTNPDRSYYEMSKPSPVTLENAINRNILNKLGTVETITRTIDITWEVKRFYEHKPATGNDILNCKYSSDPWDISVIQGIK